VLRVEAAGSVAAENAPTDPCKTTERFCTSSHTLHRHVPFQKNQDQNLSESVVSYPQILRRRQISFRSYGGSFTTEIVGVIGDTRTASLEIEPKPEIFVSHASSIGYPNSMTYFVRTTADPASLLPAVKEKIREADKNMAFSSIATIDQLVERSLNRRRFNLLLLASFAVLALILASVGLYGLISFMTAQRTHEIGIRMAFGANPRDVLKLIIGQGMALTLAGVVIGLLASLALTRLMESLLFGVSATDPVTLVVTAFVLGTVPLLACYIPARRATKVDPMVALRYE
jgi:putative ABC transport system permease protein